MHHFHHFHHRIRRSTLNGCRRCGHTWYERGRHLAPYCPNCRSSDTEIVPRRPADATPCLIVLAVLGAMVVLSGLFCVGLPLLVALAHPSAHSTPPTTAHVEKAPGTP